MKDSIRILFIDKIVRFGTIASLVFLFITLIYIGIHYRQLPPVLPLYNQMPWGEDRLGSRLEIFLLPLITLVITLGNTFFASFLYDRMPLIARALAVTSFLIALVTIIFIFRTIQLVV